MTCTFKFSLLAFITLAANPFAAVGQFEAQQPQQAQPAQQTPQRSQPDVMVTVNGDPITEREVNLAVQRELQEIQARDPQQQQQQLGPEIVKQIKPKAIDGLIESRLVEQYAIDKGPDVAEQEIDASIDHLKAQLQEQGTSFDQFLVSQGHTRETFQDRIKGSIAWHKLQNQQATDEKLGQFFQENQDQFGAENFDQVRSQVANAYVDQLWKQIIAQMRPNAEIVIAGQQRPQATPR
jgi:uncharacterized membrane protein YheB (UPF0754 family)